MAKKHKGSTMMVVDHTNKELEIFIYIRVSTDRQAEEGYSIEIQIEKLLLFVKLQFGENVKYEIFVDDGYSGSSLDRPEMTRMLELIKQGRGSHVVVYKLDRLSRSQKDTLYLIEDVFIPANISLLSMLENFDTSSAFGRVIVGVLSVFAQFERENIYERTRSGMLKRIESGLWRGGGGVPFGYDYDQEQGILVPNKDAPLVPRVFSLYLQGESMIRIAEELGLKYDRLVYQILTRETYTGVITYRGQTYPGRHVPLISVETFELVKQQMKERSSKHTYQVSPHLLTGLIYCGECGARMRYMKWGKAGYALVCYSRDRKKEYMVKDPNCENIVHMAAPIEQIIVDDIFDMLQKSWSGGEDDISSFDVVSHLERKRNKLQQRLKKLYLCFSDDSDDDALMDTITETKQEIAQIEQQIRDEQSSGWLVADAMNHRDQFLSMYDNWLDFWTDEERQSIIRAFVNKIIISPNHIKIDYKTPFDEPR